MASTTRDARNPRPPGGKALARLRYELGRRRLAPGTEGTPLPTPPLEVSMLRARGFVAGARAPVPPPDPDEAVAARPARPYARSPYLAAARHRDREAIRRPEPAREWRFMGPDGIADGQTYGAYSAGAGAVTPVSGRVSAVAVDPADGAHLLVGAGAGGIWESSDAGATWAPRTDFQPTLAMGAIAFVPGDPRTVFAGTGEGNAFHWQGVGVLRSDDGGTTWNLIATEPFAGTGFFDLQVDPENPQTLFAATTACLAVSTDAGATWAAQLQQPAWTVSIAPGGGPGREVLAATAAGVLASVNGGAWAQVQLPGAPASYARATVCHAPGDPGVAYVFGTDGTTPFLWQRTEAGGAWQPIAPPPGVAVDQAWYDWVAAVSPRDSQLLYVGSIDLYRGGPGLAGWVWEDISTRFQGDSIHPDQHALAFDPGDGGVVYAGCDGGVFRSPDGGDTWQSLNRGLGITQYNFIALNPDDAEWVLGGTQDNGTLLRRDAGEGWALVGSGDGGDCGVNGQDPRVAYLSYHYMGLSRSESGGAENSWTMIGPTLPPPPYYQSAFYAPVTVSGRLVAQAGATVYVSPDQGNTWTSIPLPQGEVASALNAVTESMMWVGTATGGLYRLLRMGPTWAASTVMAAMPQPGPGNISSIFVDPARPNDVWITYSDLGEPGTVFFSADGGLTWQNRAGGLPLLGANSVAVDPADPRRVFAGTDAQVYESTDQGLSWSVYGQGLPNAMVGEIAIHARARLLRAGTASRGVWEIEI